MAADRVRVREEQEQEQEQEASSEEGQAVQDNHRLIMPGPTQSKRRILNIFILFIIIEYIINDTFKACVAYDFSYLTCKHNY